jgi:hypothetical protein
MSEDTKILSEILAVLLRFEEREAREHAEGAKAMAEIDARHRARWDEMLRERNRPKATLTSSIAGTVN